MTLMDRASLIARVEAGERFEYLCFWGHRQKAPGQVDASCLSQFFPAAFEIDRVVYPTAEHWMMAQKARLFGDDEMLEEILAAKEPLAAKHFGRKVRGFDAHAWTSACVPIVVRGNEAKFGQNPKLSRFLLDTGHRVLVEASPRDTIWGIGL